ncbi:hypothetical protein [Ornithinibacter sp.]|jgi:hypothetical protein|uniref:hypothetical protein n=1 Tax=Ornithinibacter sp. TaxID=2862748 RepID=UPI002BAD604D|nr:hypothetical protein [Ornithinibacter sp.]HQW75142.1 hypothetical protein [Ornithinibacter sp.]HQX88606.1 hypothetical protein [Ornithinibacter sp.]HQZ11135.1 hypothetical protein [Ornithinibacter sp.]HRA27552.1 hypothetical protein [Ornithinibacter sp.]
MSHDVFEDELRTLLHGATQAENSAFHDIDTAEVLGSGRRVERRRRMAAAGATLAAVTVVGIGSWAALDGPSDRALQVPATRTSAPATGPVTALLEPFADLSSSTDGRPLSIPGPRRVGVRVAPDATPDLEYLAVGADGSTSMMGGSSLDGIPALASTWGTAGEDSHVLVGVLPEQAKEFQLITPMSDEGGHASTSVRAPLTGTGRQAFAVRFEVAGDADTVRHLLWWDGRGAVHDETGAIVPAVTLDDAQGTTVFVSEDLDRMGTFSTDGSQSMMELDGSLNSSGRPFLATGRGEGSRIDTLFAAVVPAGTTPGTVTPATGTEVTDPLTVSPLAGTDLAILWTRYSAPEAAKGSAYRSITWDEAGRTVTERP